MKYNSPGQEKGIGGQNMPCWYYDKADLKKTPSFFDGLNAETEARYRREGPRFIFDMGTKLGLHHETIATAIVFFHRFYMFHSFKKFPRHITATCCLFLAGKVEETPKKCKDLIKVARGLLNEAQFAQFGDDPKEEVLTFEKVLLQTIKFDFTVEHPYKYMLQYAKALKGERSKIEKLVQMSWTFINDSLCTSLCLQWEPQIVAVAVMYLAGRLCKFEPQDWAYNRGRWWEQFIDDISTDLLEDICHQVLDQYSQTKSSKAGSSNKAKRERPKTPGDAEKGSEPQVKTSKTEPHKNAQKIKPPPPASTSQPAVKKPHTPSAAASKNQNQSSNQRRTSSNTEVVAMDTVDTGDRGTIEQSKTSASKPQQVSSSKPQTPTKSASESSSFYGSVNQYQSYMGTNVPASLGFGIQPNQFSGPGLVNQFPGAQGLGPQTPPVHQSYSSNIPPPPPPQNFHPYPPMPGSFDPGFGPNRFPLTPPSADMFQQNQGQFPPSYSGQPATGLATVRITGRRDQKSGPQWS